jgi:hypothetical protein
MSYAKATISFYNIFVQIKKATVPSQNPAISHGTGLRKWRSTDFLPLMTPDLGYYEEYTHCLSLLVSDTYSLSLS